MYKPAYSQNIDFNIQSTAFNIEDVSSLMLVLKYNEQGLSVAVADPDSQACMVLEHHTFDPAANDTSLIVRLQNIWSKHIFLNAAFWKKVLLVPCHTDFVFAPTRLTDDETAEDFLKLNSSFNPEKSFADCQHLEAFGASCIAAMSRELHKWFSDIYGEEKLTWMHSNAALLQALDRYIDTDSGNEIQSDSLFLQVNGNLATLVLANPGQLRFINSFRINHLQDLLYYCLLVLDENGLEPAKTSLFCWGSVGEEFYSAAGQHFQQVNQGNWPGFLAFTNEFDEAPFYDFDFFGAVIR